MRLKLLLLFAISCISIASIAQSVGIKTNDPKATLDITAANPAAPDSTTGILIPRIDAFPMAQPSIDQNGMMVFLTTDNKFYFWNNATLTWIPVQTGIDLDNDPSNELQVLDFSGTTLGISDGNTVSLSSIGGDITSVTAGDGITGGGTTGDVTVTANVDNGLNVDAGADAIQLGGVLTENTTIAQGTNTMDFTTTAVDGFSVDGTSFSVDAANDRVGLGSNTPSHTLHVVNTAVTTSTAIVSMLSFADGGDTQASSVAVPSNATNVSVTIEGTGDLDHSSEFFTVFFNGTQIGGNLNTGLQNCSYSNVLVGQDVSSNAIPFNGASMPISVTSSIGTNTGFNCPGTAIQVRMTFTFTFPSSIAARIESGTIRVDELGGGGTQMVIADANGDLGTQSIIDNDANNEIQDLSSSSSGTNRTINITGGTGTTINVADNDNSSSNELQSLSISGSTITLNNGGGNVTVPSSADNLGNHSATSTLNMNNNNIINVNYISTRGFDSYDKLRLWNNSNYTIGMNSSMTFGFLNDYATTFTMNQDNDRGWIWRDVNDAKSDGAMSLTTDGRLTLKSTARFQSLAGAGTRMVVADGNGDLATQAITVGDITGVTAGAGLTGGGPTGAVTVTANANNGLNVDAGADRIQLGGLLTEATTITAETFPLNINLNSSGDFIVQDNGVNHFQVYDNGQSFFGDDTYWRLGSTTTGDILARMYDSSDDGILDLYENNAMNIRLHGNGTTIFNSQNLSTNDLRIESLNDTYNFFSDASTNRVGLGTNVPQMKMQINEASGNSLNLVRNDGTVLSNERLGAVAFDGTDGGVTTDPTLASASIIAVASEDFTTVDKGAHLTFRTKVTNADFGNANLERMRIEHDGDVYMANDMYIRDGATTSGDVLIRAYDSSDDGVIDIYENNAMNIRLHGNGTTIFNSQNISTNDLRIESLIDTYNFFSDASTNRIGIGTSVPAQKLHVVGTTRISTLAGVGTRMVVADVNGDLATQAITVGDITGVFAGTGLTGGGTSGNVTLNAVGTNGLTANANDVRLGGTLIQATTITQGVNNMTFNLNNTGDFTVQDNGTDHFQVRDDGLTFFGDDTYWRDGSTNGTNLAILSDDGDDGRFRIYENGITSVDLDANTQFVFNEQGLDRDFRIETDIDANAFRVNAGTNRIGIGDASPTTRLEIAATDGQSLMLSRQDAAIVANDQLGGIGFDGSDGNTPDDIREASAAIIAFASETQGTGDKGGRLTFWTSPINQDDDTDGFERLRIDQDGNHYVGGDMYWRDASVSGTNLVRIVDDGDDGQMIIYENGVTQILLDANGTSVFNEQGLSRDFRIETDTKTHGFFVDASENNIGVGTVNLDRNFHIAHDQFTGLGGLGGLEIEQSFTGNQWTLYTSQSSNNLALYYNSAYRGAFDDVTGVYTNTSDLRLKKNIENIGSTIDNIMKLRPTEYHFKTQEDSETKSPGFIAQEVKELFPNIVSVNEDDTNGNGINDLHMISYTEFIPYIIKAMQEQQEIINKQQEQINQLLLNK